MSYVSSRVKMGRPKTTSLYPTADLGTKELREKREKFGLTSSQEPMTCLFVLWSRKSITYDQFIAGCYYEELHYKLKRSSGCLQGTIKSSLARLQDGEVRVIRNKLPMVSINEHFSSLLADVRNTLSLIHPNGISLLDRLIVLNDLSLLSILEKTASIEMKIVQKCLNMIDDQMKKHVILQENMLNISGYATGSR